MPCFSVASVYDRPALPKLGLAFAAGVLFALFGPARAADAQAAQTFPLSGTSPAITISGTDSSAHSSAIAVSNPNGTEVSSVSVTLNGVTTMGASADGTQGYSLETAVFWLQSPSGQKFVLLGATGDGLDGNDIQGSSGNGLQNATITIADSASVSAPGTNNATQFWSPQNGNFTVKPTSYASLVFGSAPLSGVLYPSTDGSATLASAFSNSGAEGTWTLWAQTFIVTTPIQVSNWTLTLNYVQNPTTVATTTTVSSSLNPANASSTVTYTASVSAAGTPVNGGTMTFTAIPNGSTTATTLCSAVTVSDGIATCPVTANNLGQGLSTVTAAYTPASGFLASQGSTTQLVEETAVNTSGNTWCNNTSFTVPLDGTGQAYPSTINVTGYAAGQTVSTVAVHLNGLSGSSGLSGQYLLVAPGSGGQNLDFMDNVFGAPNQGPVNLVFADDAGQIPGATATDGSYTPYDKQAAGSQDNFPASGAPAIDSSVPQVPSTIHYPATFGSASETFFSNFSGAPANGKWALYVTNINGAGPATLANGWCIDLTLNTGIPTTTKVTSSKNPSAPSQPVTYTATVTNSGSPVTSGGTVTFLDNNVTPDGTVSGNNIVNLNATTGTATFTSSSLSTPIDLGSAGTTKVYEGDHTISATYSGTSVDNASLGSMVERFDNASTLTHTAGTNTYAMCNAGPIYSSQGNSGPFAPNPSNIFVQGLPGTIADISLTLNNFYTSSANVVNRMESMLEGPTKAGLDFFSGTGGSSAAAAAAGTYTFRDDASAAVPASSFGPGTYKPTSYNTTDTFTSSLSGLYSTPPSFNYSQPIGSGTFTSTFNGTDPNGTWSLFFNMPTANNAAGATGGWCLNFTETLPTISINESHSGNGVGNNFTQGQTGAHLTTTITNNGGGPTGDPSGSDPLTVVDTLNAALTYTGFSGTGWSCSTASGNQVTCTNDSAVAQGSAYPTLTLDVNVSPAAGGTFTNSVSVQGGGVMSNSASDVITVDSAPVLALSKSHSGVFSQGSTGQWLLIVTNIAASGATSGTVTVTDTLPAGYTLNSYNSTGSLWTCTGTNAITCTAAPGLAAGNSSTITLTTNIPANSPTTASNIAQAFGGGDLAHNSLANAVTSNTDVVSVTQVAATVAANSGNNQASIIDTAFASPLVALVTDGGGTPVPGVTVTFTVNAGAGGQGAVFSNSSSSITATTDSAGLVSESITANGITGAYSVTAKVGTSGPSTQFTLTNLGRSMTTLSNLTSTSATIDVFGYGITAPTGQVSFTDLTSGDPVVAPITLDAASAKPTLLPMTSTSTGANTLPVWTEIGDINGDGKPDLVTTLYETDQVSVQLGNGDGTFQTASNTLIAPGYGPSETHLVSLRGNGVLDIITGSFNTNQIAVLLGNGDGTFQSPVFYTAGTAGNWAWSLTTGDFDHDGKLDVAVANTLDDTVSVLLGDGSGGLTESGPPTPVGHDPEAIRAGDFDGDGYSDLAIANFKDDTVSILKNRQDGTFAGSTVNVGNGPQALAITGTGASLKLAVANYLDNTVSVMNSNGDGSFGATTVAATGTGPDDVRFTDLNGDGLPDLVVTNYNSSDVTLLQATSGGTYTSLGSFAVGSNPYSAAIGDIDLNGTPDLITSNCFSNSTGTLLSGTQIEVPLTGLSLTPGDSFQATYTHDSNSKYGDSSSASSVAPNALRRTLMRNGMQLSNTSKRIIQHE